MKTFWDGNWNLPDHFYDYVQDTEIDWILGHVLSLGDANGADADDQVRELGQLEAFCQPYSSSTAPLAILPRDFTVFFSNW